MIGCGGDDGGPSIGTTQDNVCDQVAEVACFNMYQCCSESEIEDFLSVTDPRTQDQCREDVQTICKRQMATLDFSLKNKHVTFDAKVLDTCLKAIVAPAGSCVSVESMAPWTEACMTSAWTGAVAVAGACDFGYECAKDSFCNPNRICTALPTVGMTCSLQSAQQSCASGLFCDAGICHALLAAGGSCTSTTQCQKGLFCDNATATPTNTCTPLRGIGEACSGSATCASSTCLPGTCVGSSNACFNNASCNGHCADDNSFCTTDGQCALGTCTGTATLCSSNANCAVGVTCVFPVKCLPPECAGSIVCAESHNVLDYCQGALAQLPGF
jgi:Dickkopf-like protein